MASGEGVNYFVTTVLMRDVIYEATTLRDEGEWEYVTECENRESEQLRKLQLD